MCYDSGMDKKKRPSRFAGTDEEYLASFGNAVRWSGLSRDGYIAAILQVGLPHPTEEQLAGVGFALSADVPTAEAQRSPDHNGGTWINPSS